MLQKISLRFDPVEDRLELRLVVKSADGTLGDHWLHLTRRVCASWRQDLQAMVDVSAQTPANMNPAAKRAVSAAHHKAMASQVPVRTETVAEVARPSTPPALVTKIVCGRRKGDVRWTIRFEFRSQPSLSVVLNQTTLHGLVDAVARRVKTAEWGLAALAAEAPQAIPAVDTAHLH